MAKFENISGQTMDSKLVATPTSDGLMSASDKAKLDTIEEGAGGYVHPATHPATMITQDTTHRFVTDTEKSTWNAKASTAVATTSKNGLMSSADKTKLDGIATGANKTVVDSSLSSSSTNPVQNKVINTALAGKAPISHTHTKSQITDFPSSLPANGGNADTVDGKHATYFATSGHTHTSLLATDLTGQTKSLDSLNLNTGNPKVAYYVCISDGGGENITGRPDDNNKKAFLLEVQSIRFASSSDYITKQIYTIGSLKLSYVRYCTNGTWSAWERMYTSVQKPTPSEIGAAASSHTHTGSQVTQDSTHRFVTDTEKSTWNGKASTAVATTSANGLMSKNDKTKLDGIATGANKYVHPTGAGNNHIPSGGSAGQFLKWSASGTAVWAADNNTTYSPATTSSNGLMSATDKVKLDGIATGANKTVVDSALSSSSTNPVQNKVINTALAGKAASSHNHTSSNITDLATFVDNRIKSKLLAAFPVGTVISSTNSANPSTYIGGTWQAFAPGRVLVGAGSGNDGSTSMSFTAGSTGGKYKHKLSVSEIPSHTHKISVSLYTGTNTPGGSSVQGDGHGGIGRYPYDWATSTGGNGTHNNIQPYTVIYYWKRTA